MRYFNRLVFGFEGAKELDIDGAGREADRMTRVYEKKQLDKIGQNIDLYNSNFEFENTDGYQRCYHFF